MDDVNWHLEAQVTSARSPLADPFLERLCSTSCSTTLARGHGVPAHRTIMFGSNLVTLDPIVCCSNLLMWVTVAGGAGREFCGDYVGFWTDSAQNPSAYLRLAGNQGMENKMAVTITGSMRLLYLEVHGT